MADPSSATGGVNRRKLLAGSIVAGTAAFTVPALFAAAPRSSSPGPVGGRFTAAFLLDEGATMIDFAGPWEVFQDTWAVGLQGFNMFTVSRTTAPIHTSAGMEVVPHYSLADAPPANVIVIPAQLGGRDPTVGADKRAWLKERHASTDVIMSVCTGAFLLARTGLLDGLTATTHHNFYDQFEAQFPNVHLLKHVRFVDHGRLMTAGGLSSGIDGALHLVERFYGRENAVKVAENMEYQSQAWLNG